MTSSTAVAPLVPAKTPAAAQSASLVLTTGLLDQGGQSAAAWCAALAMLAATGLCAALVQLKCIRLDTGIWIVLAGALALVLRPALLAAALLLLMFMALATAAIFSADERRQIVAFLRDSARHAWPGRH